MLCQAKYDRGNEVGQTHIVILGRLQKGLHLKPRQQHDRCACVESHVQDHHQAIDMEEGQYADQCVGFEEIIKSLHLLEICHQVAVREHHAFRQSCRPARIWESHEVICRIDYHFRWWSTIS